LALAYAAGVPLEELLGADSAAVVGADGAADVRIVRLAARSAAVLHKRERSRGGAAVEAGERVGVGRSGCVNTRLPDVEVLVISVDWSSNFKCLFNLLVPVRMLPPQRTSPTVQVGGISPRWATARVAMAATMTEVKLTILIEWDWTLRDYGKKRCFEI
jgi:hypothetical protein